MMALQPASTGAGSDEHAQFAEPGVAHPLSVGLEVAERPVDFAGLGVGEGQVSGGGGQGGDVAGVEVGQPGGQPGRVVLAEDGGEEVSQVVQVLAGVAVVDDLGGGGEALPGQVPDPGCAVAEHDELADVF